MTVGTSYSGIPGNIAIPGAIGITSSTAANPTVIQTSAPHGLTSGDLVDVTDHHTNTGANCFGQTISVVDSTHFSIPVDTHTYSAGGATGFVWPQAFTGNKSLLPASGDPYSYLTYRPGMACVTDRDAWELTATGIYRLANSNTATGSGSAIHSDPTFATPWAYIKTGAAGGYALNPVVTGSPSGGTAFGSLLASSSGPIPVGFLNNDVVEVQLDFSFLWTGSLGSDANQWVYFALNYAYYVPGTATPTFTQQVPQSAKWASAQILTISGSNYQTVLGGNMTIRGLFQPGTGTLQGAGATDSAGLFDCQLYAGQGHGSSGDTPAEVIGDAQFMCKIWRLTGVKVES